MSSTGIIYVGTVAGLAIYRDAGGALERVGHRLRGHAVRAIVAPLSAALVVSADGLPAQQSFDGGESWMASASAGPEPVGLRAATTGEPAALANPRLMGATAYARLGGRGGVLLGAGAGGALLFRSRDDGIHWEPATGAVSGRITTIVPAAYRPGTAWAGTESGHLLCSDDQGVSWREAAREPSAILCILAVGAG